MLIRTDYAAYFAEHTPRNVCFAEQDAKDAPGAAAEAAEATEELDLAEETPEPSDDELDELEIGPTKFKVPKPIKEAWNGLQKTVQTEKETVKAEKAAIEKERASFAEGEKVRAAILEEVAEIKGIDRQLSPYLKLTAADWMAWAEQDPDAAKKAQMAVTALQMDRQKVLESVQAKAKEFGENQSRTQAEHMAKMERELIEKVPNWTPERGKAVEKALSEAGIPIDQMGPWLKSPAVIAFVEDALAARGARERARVAREAAAKAAKEQQGEPEPAPRMRGASSSTSNVPRDSDDGATWLKKRQAELRRKGMRF
jgi:hypothetical protein